MIETPLITMVLQMTQPSESPFFTNDIIGLAKVVIVILAPIFGLVIWFLRYGPNDAIRTMRGDLNGYGERLNRVEVDRAAEQQEAGQMAVRMAKSEQDREGLHGEFVRMETRITGNERRIEENQRAILDAAHKIELQVASLAAGANVGKELRDGLDRIADIMESRDRRTARGERGEVE